MNIASTLRDFLSDDQKIAISKVVGNIEFLPVSCLFHRGDEFRVISRNRVIPDDFVYILIDGALDCKVGDQERSIQAGEFMMVPAGRPHEAFMAEETESYQVFALHMHLFDETHHRFFEKIESSFGVLRDLAAWKERLSACTCLMGDNPEIGGQMMRQIVIQIILEYLLKGNRVSDLPVKTDQRITALLANVRREPDKPWTVAVMAAKCYLSVSRFRELFSACTGISPKKYVQRIRLAQARSLLATNPTLTVQNVADAVGIPDAHYFHAIYKTTFGETPRQRVFSEQALENESMSDSLI